MIKIKLIKFQQDQSSKISKIQKTLTNLRKYIFLKTKNSTLVFQPNLTKSIKKNYRPVFRINCKSHSSKAFSPKKNSSTNIRNL